jgi:hypothetical protein
MFDLDHILLGCASVASISSLLHTYIYPRTAEYHCAGKNVLINIRFFCGMTYRPVNMYQCFAWNSSLNFNIPTLMTETEDPQKRWHTPTKLHGVTHRQTVILKSGFIRTFHLIWVAEFEVLAMKNTIFWDVTPYIRVQFYWLVHLRSLWVSQDRYKKQQQAKRITCYLLLACSLLDLLFSPEDGGSMFLTIISLPKCTRQRPRNFCNRLRSLTVNTSEKIHFRLRYISASGVCHPAM